MTGKRRLSRSAALYLGVILAGAAAVALYLLPRLASGRHDWLLFVLLAAGAATSQIFAVKTISSQAYYTTTVFIVAAALLLPPELVVLVAVVAHVPEWIRYRYPWFIQTFNIANYVLSGLAAWLAAHSYFRNDGVADTHAMSILAGGMLAAVAFVLVNHTTLAEMLRHARGHSYRQSGLFTFENVTTDVVLAALGTCFAIVWHVGHPLALFSLAPLVLIHRSLSVPRLEAEARMDGKTGLYNAKHLKTVLEDEIERAERFQRPLSLIVADLDLLRDVNNTHGHLAGDAVLLGVAEVLRTELRAYDVAARFGGEEFAILLPETDTAETLLIAERIRRAVQATRFEARGSLETIRATISLGIATYREGTSGEDLMHEADLALYDAKARGRNQVSALGAAAKQTTSIEAPPAPADLPEALAPAAPPVRPLPRMPQLTLVRPAAAVAVDRRRKRAPAGRTYEFAFPRRWLDPSWPEKAIWPLIGVLAAGAVTAFAFSAGGFGTALTRHPVALGLLALLTLTLQLFAVRLHGPGTSAASGIGILSAGFAFGVGAGMAVAVVAALANWIRRGSEPRKGIFDVANFSISTAAAITLFQFLDTDSAMLTLLAALSVGLVYQAVNIMLLCLVMGLSERRSPARVWNERFRWGILHYSSFGPLAYACLLGYQRLGVIGLLAFAVPPLLIMVSMRQTLERTRRSAEEVKAANAELAEANRELEESRERQHRTHLATIAALSKSMEAKDYYTSGHTERVAGLAVALAERLGYSGEELAAIEIGALLHDVGKIGVPEQILQKAGPLDDGEWEQMRRHPVISEYILAEVDLHPIVSQIVRSSHERIDGMGYPDGLRGDEIPLPARIVLVADALDALTTERPYRAPRDFEGAMAEIKAHAGTQFCRVVVAALEILMQEQQGEGASSAGESARLGRQWAEAAAS